MTTLEPDCAQCVGLCCVALPFRPSHGFAFAKDAGEPCRHLDDAYRCSIHASLRESGMGGCTSYECFGAGQHVTQVVYGGATWRGSADGGAEMFAVFAVVQRLHEMLVLLDQASALAPGPGADPVARAGLPSHLGASRGHPRHRARPPGRAGRRGPARGEPLGPRRRAVVRRPRPGRPGPAGHGSHGCRPARCGADRRRPPGRRPRPHRPARRRPPRLRPLRRRPLDGTVPHPAPAQLGPGECRRPCCRPTCAGLPPGWRDSPYRRPCGPESSGTAVWCGSPAERSRSFISAS